MFFPKLFVWVKDHGKSILTVISIVVAIVGGIQTIRANRWEREALRLDGKLKEQKGDQDRYYGEVAKSRAERRIKEAEEKKKREALESRIAKVIREGEKAKKALELEKTKTATLPPTELVAEIVERIGFESNLIKSGLYLFTQKGTERTLDRFKDGEFYLSEYNKFQGVLDDHKTEIESFNDSIAECEATAIDNLKGWDDCRETLATALAGREADKKTAKASVWRGRKQGAFWTIVIAGGLKLFGVW